jgi:hypothetical protein
MLLFFHKHVTVHHSIAVIFLLPFAMAGFEPGSCGREVDAMTNVPNQGNKIC